MRTCTGVDAAGFGCSGAGAVAAAAAAGLSAVFVSCVAGLSAGFVAASPVVFEPLGFDAPASVFVPAVFPDDATRVSGFGLGFFTSGAAATGSAGVESTAAGVVIGCVCVL